MSINQNTTIPKIRDFFADRKAPSGLDNLTPRTDSTAQEVKKLRQEVAEIKKLLEPSIILTGRSVLDEYRNLAR